MPLFTWNISHSVGIDELDRQHVAFFAIVNDLYDALKRGDGHIQTDATLEKLVAFAEAHFEAEEQLMANSDFPGLPMHREHHQELDERLRRFTRRYKGGEEGMTIDLLIFLGDWLTDHIERYDKAYVPWINRYADHGRHMGNAEKADQGPLAARG